MKKKLIIIITMATMFLCADIFPQKEMGVTKSVNSKITEITLFSNSSEITRESSAEISKGVTTLKFSKLSGNIVKNSIQFIADNNLTILSVSLRDNFLTGSESSEDLMRLEKRLTETEEKITAEKTSISVINEDLDFLRANRQISGGNSSLTITSLQQLSEFYSGKIASLKQKELLKTKALNELISIKDSIQRQIGIMKSGEIKAAGEIIVKVSSPKSALYKLKLSYLTENASWRPVYDIRSESTDKPVKLNYKAIVSQRTGENWENVTLRLSSSNPRSSGVLPILEPYYIRYPQFRSMNDALMLEEVIVASGAKKEMVAPPVAYSPSVINEKQTSIEFEAVNKYTINSDGESYTVDLGSYEMPAIYNYYAVPKLDKDAFLVARIPDREKYTLLSGEASIFFEGRFVGTTFIDTENYSDTLELSFGRDPGISVIREQTTDFTSKRFIGTKREDESGWKIVVRNNKNVAIDIKIKDQLPLSSNEEIEVNAQNISGGNLDPLTGEIRWRFSLLPAANKQIDLNYIIKYPKNKTIVK